MMQTRQVAICLCVYRHASDFLDSTPRGTARNLDELFDKVRPQRSIEVLNLKQRHGGQKEFARPFEWILPYLTYHYGAAIYKANYTQVYSIASISHAAASCQMIKLFFCTLRPPERSWCHLSNDTLRKGVVLMVCIHVARGKLLRWWKQSIKASGFTKTSP
jgi:hypothetical protein